MSDTKPKSILKRKLETNEDPIGGKQSKESTEEVEETKSEANGLPEGFFDDPVKDSKARKVVHKDPIDEQYKQFQKEISDENIVSANIIEEDVEDLQIERNLEEVEEQIANWIKVNEMQKRADLLHNTIVSNRDISVKQEDSDSDVDEQDLNVFSNWRSRTALK